MVKIYTSPSGDVSVIRENEKKCFRLIRNYIENSPPGNCSILEKTISPGVEGHPAYTRPYYTITKDEPEGLALSGVYEGRDNLVCVIEGEKSAGKRNTAVNAHIDVVAPFFPPRVDGDKANVVIMLGALSVLERLSRENSLVLKNRITAMFVIEEETGGNGSLSLVMEEKNQKSFDSILVLEAADNNIYPANRGAVWFKCDIKRQKNASPGASLLEAASFAVLSMQKEGGK